MELVFGVSAKLYGNIMYKTRLEWELGVGCFSLEFRIKTWEVKSGKGEFRTVL